ncbi:MAG: LysO family transporter [Bacillota bacterium]
MRILLYIAIIFIGGLIGFKDLLSDRILSRLSKIQHVCLLFLLFIMGANIGINKEIVNAFYKLGYQALILSILSIIFSVAGVKCISRFLIPKQGEDVTHDN